MNTAKDCLQGEFAALLRGDTAERDRLCARAERLIEVEQYADAVERVLDTNFYVTAGGVAIPSATLAKAGGVMQ